MFAFLLVAQALGVINQYLEKEVLEKDFWDVPSEAYKSLSEEDKNQNWFMVNPEKLKEKYRISNEALIVSEEEKTSILEAFKLLYEYSKTLPEEATFKERLLMAKGLLPPAFFPSQSKTERCKVVLFKNDFVVNESP